ncbi:hypothetical protein Tco_0516702 [Tanacetum coccineum]
MADLAFVKQHNMVAYLEKTEENADFHQILDFLTSSSINFALTVSPTIYASYIEQFWNTACLKTINSEKQIHANVDGKAVVVSESSVRRDLHLNDEDGTACLTTNEIFENLALMGYEPASDKLTFYKGLFSPQWKYLIHTILHCLSSKSTSWDQFSTNLASAIICLAKGQKFNFSKLIFDGMLRNLDPKKFLMYPRFLNLVLPVQATTKVKTVNGERQIQALVDKKKVIITETSIRSDLHFEDADGTDCLPTTTFFEELARMGRKQKKNTKVPHPSDSTADLPNEEHVPTHSNDPLLNGEDRMKLTELIDMCTKLSERVLNLEHTKTAQAQEITNLKLRVKKLEKKAGLRIDKFKRLYKGKSRIEAIDRDAEVTLVETQRRNDEDDDNLMFNTGVLNTDEIDLAQEITLAQALAAMKSAKPKEKDVVQESSENVSTSTTMVSTATTIVVATPAITTPPQQRAKGIAFIEPIEFTVTTTVPSQKSKDKGKAILIEPKKQLKKKNQIELDEELAREIEAKEQAELERIQKERAAQEEASREAIYEEWDNEQAMMEADYELAANLQENERETISIEEQSRRLA